MQRKLIRSALTHLLYAAHAAAAISSFQVWEVRPATGSDLNGGGFDASVSSPGTDYSQQGSPQVTFNGSTITATAAGVTATIVIAGTQLRQLTLETPCKLQVGQDLQLGFYTITAAAEASGGGATWTLDRNCTTGAASAMVGRMGGAVATLGKLFNTSASPPNAVVSGNSVWLNGTLNIAQTIWIDSFSGGGDTRTVISGYGVTRGDGIQQTIVNAINSANTLAFQSSTGVQISNIAFINTAGTPAAGIFFNYQPSTFVTLQNVLISGATVGIDGTSGTYCNNLFLFDVEIKSGSSIGLQNGGQTFVFGSWVHGNGGDGIKMTSNEDGALYAYATVSSANTGVGFNDTSSSSAKFFELIDSVAYGNTSDGIRVASGSGIQSLVSVNTISYGNGGFGLNFPSVPTANTPLNVMLQYNNAFGSNTSGARNSGAPPGVSDITLTANPFVSVSTGNFALNSTAGGGAALYSAGFPGVMPGGTGYAAVGALQPAASSGGGQHGYPIVQ